MALRHTPWFRFARGVLLAALLIAASGIVLRVLRYPALLSLSGARLLLAESLALLALYAGVIWRVTSHVRPRQEQNLWLASRLGALGGTLEILNLLVERFAPLPGRWNSVATPALTLTAFALWAATASLARHRGARLVHSVGLALWSSAVTMTLAVTAGVALELYLAPVPLASMRAWAEFQRTGWNDLQAFAIANTLDSLVSHFVLAPVVACVVSLLSMPLSAALGRVRRSRRGSRRPNGSGLPPDQMRCSLAYLPPSLL